MKIKALTPKSAKRSRSLSKVQVYKLSSDTEGILNRLKAGLAEINGYVVGRSELLNNLLLCLLAGQHAMIEGPPGTAKSRLVRLVFSLIDGGKKETPLTFKKQLSPGTQVEELFGVLDQKALRQDSRWVYNTEGMLPRAHFAFLDEFFRAPNTLLSTLLGVLNEREFFNGANTERCPLITAVGTTNFLSEEMESQAVRDRFFVVAQVNPLSTVMDRVAMLKAFLRDCQECRTDVEKIVLKNTITLDELRALQHEIMQAEIPDKVISLYDSMISSFQGAVGNTYQLSDRRRCWGLLSLKLGILEAQFEGQVADESIIARAFPALCSSSNQENHAKLLEIFEREVTQNARREKESVELAELDKAITSLVRRYDPMLAPKDQLRLRGCIDELIETLNSLPEESQMKIPEHIVRMDTLRQQLTEVSRSLETDISARAGASASPEDNLADDKPASGSASPLLVGIDLAVDDKSQSGSSFLDAGMLKKLRKI